MLDMHDSTCIFEFMLKEEKFKFQRECIPVLFLNIQQKNTIFYLQSVVEKIILRNERIAQMKAN